MPNCPFLAMQNNCGKKLVDKTLLYQCVYIRRNINKTKLIPYECINIRRKVEKTKLILYERLMYGEMLRKQNLYRTNVLTHLFIFLVTCIMSNMITVWITSSKLIFYWKHVWLDNMTNNQDLSGQYAILTRHCLLTGRYFKPCIDRADDKQRDLTGE